MVNWNQSQEETKVSGPVLSPLAEQVEQTAAGGTEAVPEGRGGARAPELPVPVSLGFSREPSESEAATREFPGIGLLSVPSCPRGLCISLNPHLCSFWLIPGASGMAQEETPGTTGRGRWESPKGVWRGMGTPFRLF